MYLATADMLMILSKYSIIKTCIRRFKDVVRTNKSITISPHVSLEVIAYDTCYHQIQYSSIIQCTIEKT